MEVIEAPQDRGSISSGVTIPGCGVVNQEELDRFCSQGSLWRSSIGPCRTGLDSQSRSARRGPDEQSTDSCRCGGSLQKLTTGQGRIWEMFRIHTESLGLDPGLFTVLRVKRFN